MARAGWIVSIIGHIGALLMFVLVREATSIAVPELGAVVPIEIVTMAPESNVRALAVPNQDVAPAVADTQTEPEVEPAPSPAPAPTPRPRRPNAADEQSALLGDVGRRLGQTPTQGQTADRNQRGAGLGTAEVASMEDRIRSLTRQHMRRCWRVPADLPDPERLVVTVEWEIDRNGHLRGQPRVTNPPLASYVSDPFMRTAVQSALRAVSQCSPYPFPNDPVVGEHYDLWRTGEFTFRPEQ